MQHQVVRDTFDIGKKFKQDICLYESCTHPARYKGYCFTHWKMAEPMVENEDSVRQVGESFVDVCSRCNSNEEVGKIWGISADSVRRKCAKLHMQSPTQRNARRAKEYLSVEKPTYEFDVTTSGSASPTVVYQYIPNQSKNDLIDRAMMDVVKALRTLTDPSDRERVARAAIDLVGPEHSV